jgi:hypothetical protein
MRRVILAGLAVATVVGSGCNQRVFVEVPPTCDGTIAADTEIPAEKAADILIVVDNSGSMQEEQTRLAEAFIKDDGSCPIPAASLKDFARCDEELPPEVCRFANPTADVLANELSECGFIQVLAAFENDFRIGVITTDVGLCDNRLANAQADRCIDNVCAGSDAPCTGETCESGWGNHPQRGCLQPNGRDSLNKIIARQDLLDGDQTNDDIAARFTETLLNIRTFGTGIERGLDAAAMFLDPAVDRDSRCNGDLDSFLRDDAKLVVIFLTDEEDCSRDSSVGDVSEQSCADPDGCEIYRCVNGTCSAGRPEFEGEVCGEFPEHFSFENYPTNRCYEDKERLTPPAQYAAALKRVKQNPKDVSVAVIAGGLPNADGEITEGACRFDGVGASGACTETLGASNSEACIASGNCCVADAGGRYFELAEEMGGLKDTICVNSFGQTMVKIAVFIADVETLKLAEVPTDLNLIVVEKAPAGSDVYTAIPRIPDVTVCPDDATISGWILQSDNQTVSFCGSARPAAGESVRVRAKGESASTEGGPDACVGRGTAE